MGKYMGLKGLSKPEIEAIFVTSASGIAKVLRQGAGVAKGNDNGALCIYRDDEGKIRCDVQRYCAVINEAVFTNIKDAQKWFREWDVKTSSSHFVR